MKSLKPWRLHNIKSHTNIIVESSDLLKRAPLANYHRSGYVDTSILIPVHGTIVWHSDDYKELACIYGPSKE
jgi:hypothetical protein